MALIWPTGTGIWILIWFGLFVWTGCCFLHFAGRSADAVSTSSGKSKTVWTPVHSPVEPSFMEKNRCVSL